MALDKGYDGRGLYRSIYVQLWEDVQFKKFSPDEKLVFLNLRTSPFSNIIALFPFYVEAIECQTGISRENIRVALKNLSAAGWIEIQSNLVWIKKGLKFDPNISMANTNHLKGIIRAILSLPKFQVVRDFIDFYHIQMPYPIPSQKPSQGPFRNPIPISNKDKG